MSASDTDRDHLVDAVLRVSTKASLEPVRVSGVTAVQCDYQCFVALDRPPSVPAPEAGLRRAAARELGYLLSRRLDALRARGRAWPEDRTLQRSDPGPHRRRHATYWTLQSAVMATLLTPKLADDGETVGSLARLPRQPGPYWVESSRWTLGIDAWTGKGHDHLLCHVVGLADERRTRDLLVRMAQDVAEGSWNGRLSDATTGTVLLGRQRTGALGPPLIDVVIAPADALTGLKVATSAAEPVEVPPITSGSAPAGSDPASVPEDEVLPEVLADLRLVRTAISEARTAGRPLDEVFIVNTARRRCELVGEPVEARTEDEHLAASIDIVRSLVEIDFIIGSTPAGAGSNGPR